MYFVRTMKHCYSGLGSTDCLLSSITCENVQRWKRLIMCALSRDSSVEIWDLTDGCKANHYMVEGHTGMICTVKESQLSWIYELPFEKNWSGFGLFSQWMYRSAWVYFQCNIKLSNFPLMESLRFRKVSRRQQSVCSNSMDAQADLSSCRPHIL